MNCEQVRERLNDFVDETMGERETAILDEHLSSCHGCRRDLRDLRDLVAAAAQLPRLLEPESDPWPRIAASIGERSTATARNRGRWFGWLSPPKLAAAAVAAAVLAIGLPIVQLLRAPQSGSGRGAVRPASIGAVSIDYRQAEAEFRDATTLLQEALERRKPMLRPETIDVVEENLEVINQAIEAVRVALDSDPGNRQLGDTLTAMYRRKVDFLLMAAALPAEI